MTNRAKFELKVAANGKYYFVLTAGNGFTLMEGWTFYATKVLAMKAIARVKKIVPDAAVVEV